MDDFNLQTKSADGRQSECKRCKFERKCVKKGIDPDSVEMKIRGVNHAYSSTPLYRKWKAMKERCSNPATHNYRWYGGKGVSYDASWDKWEPFRAWAMSSGYQPGLELDRIDSDKNYGPDNCRWLIKRDNIKNARRAFDADTDRMLQVEADILGISVDNLIVSIVTNHLKANTKAITDGLEVK